jgi:hypothetical protein
MVEVEALSNQFRPQDFCGRWVGALRWCVIFMEFKGIEKGVCDIKIQCVVEVNASFLKTPQPSPRHKFQNLDPAQIA